MKALATIEHRDSSHVNRGAASQLLQLQREQFEHDEAFHREVARLEIKHRLTHMALHFSKYVGYVGGHVGDDSRGPDLRRVIVDCFIIALSSANILNVRLSDEFGLDSTDYPSLHDFARRLSLQNSEGRFDAAWLLVALSIPVGRMAKACEALDHLEALAYREEIPA